MERPSVVGIAYFEVPHNSALRHMLGKVPSDYYTKKNSAKGLYEGVVRGQHPSCVVTRHLNRIFKVET
jgi:hypothetical protein